MLKKSVILAFIVKALLFADFEYTINNTNFTLSQGSLLPDEDKRYLYNYDRLRFRGDYTEENFFVTVIADAVNYLGHDYVSSNTFSFVKQPQSDTPFKMQTAFHDYYEGSWYAKVYRLYGGYENEEYSLIAGLQNISMGVGRIWTPTNLFNPKNTYALEPDETFGVAAVSYTRHLGDRSRISIVTSQKADDSFKYAASYKAYLEVADIGMNFISSDETKTAAYEIEGDLADTGIEIRSEGAYIQTRLKKLLYNKDEELFQGIIGADYGFENGVSLIAEALYSSEKFSYEEVLLNLDSEFASNMASSYLYTALSLSYSFNIFLDGSLLYIESYDNENSRFISPSLQYTLNDYHSFMLGAMIYDGDGSAFGKMEDSYYFKYILSF